MPCIRFLKFWCNNMRSRLKSLIRTRTLLLSVTASFVLILIIPAGWVYADIIQTPGEYWRATFQQRDFSTPVSEIGRGLHFAQIHQQPDTYDIFPMRAAPFQISAAQFMVLGDAPAGGEEITVELLILNNEGQALRSVARKVMTAGTEIDSWQTMDLSAVEILSSQNYLAFKITSNVADARHEFAYEVVVHNLIDKFYSHLPLIFR